MLVDNAEPPGKDRDNIRLEYGGLVQDFRVVALGDFGTLFYALGRTAKGEVTPFYLDGAGTRCPACHVGPHRAGCGLHRPLR